MNTKQQSELPDGCGCPIFTGTDEDFPRGEWTEHRDDCPQLLAWLSTSPHESDLAHCARYRTGGSMSTDGEGTNDVR